MHYCYRSLLAGACHIGGGESLPSGEVKRKRIRAPRGQIKLLRIAQDDAMELKKEQTWQGEAKSAWVSAGGGRPAEQRLIIMYRMSGLSTLFSPF